MTDRKAYMREYQARRTARLKAEWFSSVGGRCVRCGATEDLQADHIDRSTKHERLRKGGAVLWYLPKAIREEELTKCQPLCRSCHHKKTAEENRSGKYGYPS